MAENSVGSVIDLAVARAAFQVRTLERAVHSRGPWTIAFGGVEVPAVRFVMDDRVVFAASFPDACWLEQEHPCLVLKDHGDVVATRPIEMPDEGPFYVDWALRLAPESVLA